MKPIPHFPLSVVIADDHALIRVGMRVLLENMADFRLVAEAEDGEALCRLARTHEPDIVITDLEMPHMDGLAALIELQTLPRPPRVIVLSMHVTAEAIRAATAHGAVAFLSKDALLLELELALREVARGGRYVSASVSDILLKELSHSTSPPLPQDAPDALLSPRQIEVLKLLADGRSVKETAYALGLSPKTVETHRAQILHRLGLRDTAGLVAYAIRHGLRSVE
ncbi:response regulator [Chitinimonas lacunae]|uniref:Response regulator n=1 Tax=Chitinimonas lacunae TaxID=1963018 RepID=A0ABV8MM12_9NEIS